MTTVLSLFDGLGGARIALDRLSIPCLYFASETNKYAIQIASRNYPDIIQLGDVECINGRDFAGVDLLIGGSPCQGFSKAGQGRGFSDPKSTLFFEYVRILIEAKPKYFLLENVKMKKDWRDTISNILGVQPIIINSGLVTAQNRVRYYWTNIPNVEQPADRHICLANVLERTNHKSKCIAAKDHLVFLEGIESGRRTYNGKNLSTNYSQGYRIYSDIGKSATLTSQSGGLGGYTGLYRITESGLVRKLTPLECERLQGLPDNYTIGISNTQRYCIIGNGFTIPVIEHILKNAEGLK